MKTASITIIKKRFFVIALVIAILFTSLQPTAVHAATTKKTTTKSYTPMSAEGAFGLVKVWGKDTFKITYDAKTNKVISCQASQSSTALGTDMIQKGGIKLVKKTDSRWTYVATWYMNFTILPKPLQTIAKFMGMKLAKVSSLGRVATVTVTYTVNGNGTLGHSMKYKLQVPSKVEKTVKGIAKFFTKAF